MYPPLSLRLCRSLTNFRLIRSKLFKHVRQEGHAQAVAVTTSNSEEDGAAVGGKGKKKGRRRAKR